MEQKHKQAWCERCKRTTIFVTHADFPKRWCCTSRGCNWWDTKLKQAPPKSPYRSFNWI